MVFGNLSTGIEVFSAYNPNEGTYSPDRTYTLVDTVYGEGVSKIYYYALYKVEFADESEPEWRIHGESGDKNDKSYTLDWEDDSPMANISSGADEDGLDFYAPYSSTYTTEEEGKKALKDSIPILGCRDKNATNYNYLATMDDGTCTYKEEGEMNMMPLLMIGGLAAVILLV